MSVEKVKKIYYLCSIILAAVIFGLIFLHQNDIFRFELPYTTWPSFIGVIILIQGIFGLITGCFFFLRANMDLSISPLLAKVLNIIVCSIGVFMIVYGFFNK